MHSNTTKHAARKTIIALTTGLLLSTSIATLAAEAATKKAPQTVLTSKDASLTIKFPTSWKNRAYKVSDASGVLHKGKLNKYGNARIDLKQNLAYRTNQSKNVTVRANYTDYPVATNLVTTRQGGKLLWFKEYYAKRDHYQFDLSLIQTAGDYQEVVIKQANTKRTVVEQYTNAQNVQQVTVDTNDTNFKTGAKYPIHAYAETKYFNNKASSMGTTAPEPVAFLEDGVPYKQIILR